MSSYNKRLLDHFLNPRNVGVIENADGYGFGDNPVNGYKTEFYIKVDNGKIIDIRFKTIGCTVTIASASALTELVKGTSIIELVNKKNSFLFLLNQIENELGEIPDKNWHCHPTAIRIFFNSLYDYFNKYNDKESLKKINNIIDDIRIYFESKIVDY
jgi:nitrogen fixation NifU-like protein